MTFFVANWKLIVISALAALLGLMTNLYSGARDDLSRMTERYNAFVGATKVIGEQAAETKAKDEAEQLKNLEKVKVDNEKRLPQIRANAITNYLARLQHDTSNDSSSGAVQGDGPGLRVDDGSGKECVPDRRFIEDAADDATKVKAWQAYCQLNKCPVKD